MNDTLTTNEAAPLLNLKPRTLTRYCEMGLLRCEKRGRDWHIAREEVERYARERRMPWRPKEKQGE